jgi:hypothetical protein
MKYIFTKSPYNLIIFSAGISHKEMADKFGGAISAGMINSNLEPYGESISLKMKPEEGDKERIKHYFDEF